MLFRQIIYRQHTAIQSCIYLTLLGRPSTMKGTSSKVARAEEIVDDSEPERAEIRKSRLRRNPPSSTSNPAGHTDRTLTTIPRQSIIIDVNDSGSDNDCSVIEITDSESSSKSTTFHIGTKFDPLKDLPAVGLAPGSGTSSTYVSLLSHSNVRAGGHTQTLSPALAVCNDADNRSTKILNLDRFAFADPADRKRKITYARKAQASSAPSRRALNTHAKLDVSNTDLSKILRCVCCDVAWTTRKTGIQKMSHINSCAKKHAFDNNTIQALVRQAVASYVAPTMQGKGKSKESTPVEPSKNTFLEDVMVDAAPKKKVRRQQTKTLLANVSASRDEILARAHAILSATASGISEEAPTQDYHSKLEFSDDHDPLTQAFGQSALAQRMHATTSRSLFSAIHSSPISKSMDALEILPPTPTRNLKSKSRAEACSDEIRDIGARSHISLSCENNVTIDNIPEMLHTLSIEPSAYEGYQDKNKENTPTDLAMTDFLRVTTPEKSMKKKKLKGSITNRSSASDRESRLTPQRTTSRTQKKPKKTKTVYTYGDEWESHMKNHIEQDRDLYMCILRYEPIHFNVFLGLAELYAPPSSKLKLALRKYLDGQAIHFYDEGWTRG